MRTEFLKPLPVAWTNWWIVGGRWIGLSAEALMLACNGLLLGNGKSSTTVIMIFCITNKVFMAQEGISIVELRDSWITMLESSRLLEFTRVLLQPPESCRPLSWIIPSQEITAYDWHMMKQWLGSHLVSECHGNAISELMIQLRFQIEHHWCTYHHRYIIFDSPLSLLIVPPLLRWHGQISLLCYKDDVDRLYVLHSERHGLIWFRCGPRATGFKGDVHGTGLQRLEGW